MLKLTWKQVAAWRMHRHHLDQPARSDALLSVASELCGLHAQVMSSAELTLWARMEELARDAVQEALWKHRTLVKTWAMRGTLHLLPAAELSLWHAALSTSARFLRPDAWKRYFGISMEELEAMTQAIASTLAGRMLTREELAREIARGTGSEHLGRIIAESSWGTILRPAAFSGALCFAPSVGPRVRFTHPTTWVKGSLTTVEPTQATAEITRRFFAAYGPVSCHDLARWWNGGGTRNARKWMEALGEELVQVEIEGTAGWMLAKDIAAIRDAQASRAVRLLPGFDQYVVVASLHADKLMSVPLRARVFRPQGWISPVLVANGIIHGTWRHELNGKEVRVTIQPFTEVRSWMRRGAEREAERLAAFLGYRLRLSWHPVT